ncbi:bacteriohemerythrin [Carboxydothermus pertinax]|uniref:Hemerythrin n=1 Tax=Carboxydothermus pertinax TaxID=870242 RepID=A0A1L8CRF9_9THEO|nr:hemerythrin family protein [Carboxydothermus pertinax]GAV21502.1 hemerythrin [Carboxydothermus pertinax]
MIWKESYRIGVEKVDAQHQELFHRVDEFLRAIKGPGDWEDKVEQVKKTLKFMQGYVVEHFADEEAYQQEINYPDFAKHYLIHEEFKAEVAKYAEKFAASGFNEEIVQEFGGKLMAWLIYHVVMEDQKIGAYVRSQGGGN